MDTAQAGLYDKRGRPILRGDILKVYHFMGARRKRYYMYKQCLGLQSYKEGGAQYLIFSHLNFNDDKSSSNGPYHETPDGRVLRDYEIVQSLNCDHERRLITKPALPSNPPANGGE